MKYWHLLLLDWEQALEFLVRKYPNHRIDCTVLENPIFLCCCDVSLGCHSRLMRNTKWANINLCLQCHLITPTRNYACLHNWEKRTATMDTPEVTNAFICSRKLHNISFSVESCPSWTSIATSCSPEHCNWTACSPPHCQMERVHSQSNKQREAEGCPLTAQENPSHWAKVDFSHNIDATLKLVGPTVDHLLPQYFCSHIGQVGGLILASKMWSWNKCIPGNEQSVSDSSQHLKKGLTRGNASWWMWWSDGGDGGCES